MVQTDGTGRHDSVNFSLFSVKMPNLGVHFVLKGKHCFCCILPLSPLSSTHLQSARLTGHTVLHAETSLLV